MSAFLSFTVIKHHPFNHLLADLTVTQMIEGVYAQHYILAKAGEVIHSKVSRAPLIVQERVRWLLLSANKQKTLAKEEGTVAAVHND